MTFQIARIPAELSSVDPDYIAVCRDFYNTQLEALQIFCDKHYQYGPNNIAALGISGVLSRMRDDKLNRLDHPDATLSGDSISDCHLDASNYMIIRLMLIRRQWPLPTLIEQARNLEQQAMAAVEALRVFCLTHDAPGIYEDAGKKLRGVIDL